jgi:hypothetical protein
MTTSSATIQHFASLSIKKVAIHCANQLISKRVIPTSKALPDRDMDHRLPEQLARNKTPSRPSPVL